MHSFGERDGNGNLIDGGNPDGDLIADGSGNLYGVTNWGGTAFPDGGVIYELAKSG